MLFKLIPLDQLVGDYTKKQKVHGVKPSSHYVERLIGDDTGFYEDIHRGRSLSELAELHQAGRDWYENQSLENTLKVYAEMGDVLFHKALISALYPKELSQEPIQGAFSKVEAVLSVLIAEGWDEPTAIRAAEMKFSLRAYRAKEGLPSKDKDMESEFLNKYLWV